jgi:GntR family transcriptional repressor for pyruvate dehydrogenase complex
MTQEQGNMLKARRSKTVVISRVSAPKPHDLLADQLREAILRGEISEGEALPPERELVEQTGLTRGSVRGALRTLVAEGLVETRPGRFGGNVVTLPRKESMTNSIGLFIRGRRLTLRALHETRGALEPALARLAASHRTEKDLEELKALHQELIDCAGSFQQFSQVNIKWHNAVARASGNELLSAVLHAISYGVAVSTTIEEYDTPETRKQVIHVHSLIISAIEERDGDLAERRMKQHIGATQARAPAPDTTDIPMSEDRMETSN